MSGQPGSLITTRCLAVWMRNWIVYLRTWKVNFLPPVLEPILYVVAFGVGFRMFIETVKYHGLSVSFVGFIAPGLIGAGIMNGAFFETTYASFVRMYFQKTFDAIMSAPVSVEEVITGEIIWGATKSLMSAALMLGVFSLFHLISWPSALWVLPLAFLGGFAFGSIGMVFTGMTPNIELFNLPTFLFITPMFLFSGTFFPLDTLPPWAVALAMTLPLTHVVTLTRDSCLGTLCLRDTLVSVTYLVALAAVFFPLALRMMRRRLIG